MFSSKEAHLVVLRDLAPAVAAVQQALSDAEPALVPGLQRALEVLTASTPSETDLTYEWTRQKLSAAGVDPRTDEIKAVRALRQALPGLGLAAAVELVAQAAQR